jgi:hypothetical protein
MRVANVRRRLADEARSDHKRGEQKGDNNVMHGKLQSVDFSTNMSIGRRRRTSMGKRVLGITRVPFRSVTTGYDSGQQDHGDEG